jgi:Zn-dependent peptidase ImmA (M78 family)
MKSDDSSLSPEQFEEVRRTTDALLKEANAYGRFPTPVDDILETAQLVVDQTVSLEFHSPSIIKSFSSLLGKKARPLLSGMKKILGLLHIPSGEIYLDHSQHLNRQTWIKLHEAGHGCMPHQKRMYQIVEDGEFELDPETEDLFEREANNFAAEALYQLDTYEKVAAGYVVSIKTPMELSKQFGGSIYASVRRYVTTHYASIGLAVYDTVEKGPEGSVFRLRRLPIASQSFPKKYATFSWPNPCAEGNWLWPLLRKRKLAEEIATIEDSDGVLHECEIHLFNNAHQIFVMMIPGAKIPRIHRFS